MRDQVARYVVQKAQSELITKLRDTGKVERTEKPADAPALAPAAAEPAKKVGRRALPVAA